MAKDSKQEIDYDLDVDIDQEFDFAIANESTHKIEVDAEDAWVEVAVDIRENVQKDIDVDINFNEHVVKDVDVDVWTTTVDVWSNNIIQDAWVTFDEDVNDIDLNELIEVEANASLTMDDFNLDIVSVGGSFNGAGNDGLTSVNQSNDLEDNDTVSNTDVTYDNWQAPNINAQVDYTESSSVWAGGDFQADWKSHETSWEDTYYSHSKPYLTQKDTQTDTHGWAKGWFGYDAAASSALWASVDITAPDNAFQTVVADGGVSKAGDGIGHADLSGSLNDNEGDGAVSGIADATADATASPKAFTSEILAGGNTQGNAATLNVVGGNSLDGGDIYNSYNAAGGNGHPQPYANTENGEDPHPSPDGYGDGLAIRNSDVLFDDDANDLDLSELIDVDAYGTLDMEDFNLDIDSIADSFNGPGNDYAFDVTQTNDLLDNDRVTDTNVSYSGEGWNGPFQDVTALGGNATSGDGVGHIKAWESGNSNGGDGSIAGATAVSADAIANPEAFTSSIVVGANVQINNLATSVVGGDNSTVDDIDGSFNG